LNKKNQNSILFLTTLGVYIGLLMAGSAPGIVAQQAGAMTRNFDVKDEIEFSVDLDKKPRDPNARETKFDEFALAYSLYFVADYLNDRRIQEEIAQRYGGGDGPARIHHLTYFPSFDPDLNRILGIGSEISVRNWTVSKVQSSKDEISSTMEVRYSPEIDEIFGFQEAFSSVPEMFREKWSPAADFVRSGSFVAVRNDHLIVVTRLPRAGLDALLANDAK
jgi:hypothetical protein